MGLIAKLLSFTRVTRRGAKMSDVKVDPGGGPNITPLHYSAPGDDSFPLTTDYAVASKITNSGGAAVVGYLDPINDAKSLEGDKRIYGRDPATQLGVNEVWLQSDGSVVVSNANGSVVLRQDGGCVLTTPLSIFDAAADGSIAGTNGSGSFELEAGGDFVVNGVTIDIAGNIDSPTSISAPSIVVNGKELGGHTHAAGTPPGNTGPNN